MSLRFAHPLVLILLLLLPFFFAYRRKEKKQSLPFSSLQGLPLPRRTWGILYFPLLLRTLALGFLILALARPQHANQYTDVTSEGVDILLALDTSGSMRALDFKSEGEEVDRLIAVKRVVADFIQHRVSDRIGMVVFGGMAYTQSPMTLDYDLLLSFLNQLEIGAAGEDTAIGDALALSVKRLKDLPGKTRVIILLTDGRNNAGSLSPQSAADLAVEYGIKVYTIGVGTHGPVPVLEKTIFGMRKVLVQLDIDEETLQQIAQRTGGQFFHASDTEGLKQVYATIDQLEKTTAKTRHFAEYHELFRIPLLLALGLLLLEWGLKETWLRRIP